MNKKQAISLIIMISILIIFGVISLILKNNYNTSKELIKYLENKGYQKDIGNLYLKEDDNYPLSSCEIDTKKNDCVGEALYFDIDNYILIKNKNLKTNNTMFSLSASYNYSDNKIKYTYRITYQNGVLILKGNYLIDNKKYTCNKEYSYGIQMNYKEICDDFKYDLDEFYYQIKSMITDERLLKDLNKDNLTN